MMILLIDDTKSFPVDVIARTYASGKILLEDYNWHELYLDYYLDGNFSGYEVIIWGLFYKRLPNKIKLVSSEESLNYKMGTLLVEDGYSTLDNINFIKE